MLRQLLALGVMLGLTSEAIGQDFPCAAFGIQENREVVVRRSVTIRGPNGKVAFDEGASFTPGTLFMGLDLYDLYQQYCLMP